MRLKTIFKTLSSEKKASNAQFASKFTEKEIAKNQPSSPAAIKPVTAACPLFPKNPVLLAELTLLTTKS